MRATYRQKIARITLDAMVQFVGLLDADGTVLEINHVALNAVGIDLSEVEGKPFWTTFWWQVSEEINRTLRDAILRAAGGEFVRWDAEIYGRAGGKETIIIDASLMPVKDDNGVVVFIAAEGRDITEKKAQEREIARQREELAQLDVLKTQFFANISHEFRTPLTLMIGPLEEVIGRGSQIPAEVHSTLQVAHRNSLRLLRLVNSLLDFSRIEAGRVQASFKPVDLSTFTAELASTFRSVMEKAGIALKVECPALSEPVYVDPEMWEKIVLNLLSNAFKYTFEGSVTVQIAQHENYARLIVRDTGIGIPEKELPHLFERFHRVEGARGRTMEGSGIGLALVAELAQIHQGRVSVESKVGEGTAFTIHIPLGKAHLPAERIGAPNALASTATGADSYVEEARSRLPKAGIQPAGPEISGAAAKTDDPSIAARALNGRVLVADDNADMLGYVCGLLGARYEVAAVANGAEALRVAEERLPDLVLTDVMMPELDGFGLLQRLRENPRTKFIPVILLSARAGEEARSEGMDAGADDYLVKPFSARELLARVGAHLKLSRLRRQADEAVRTSEERLRFALEAGGGVGTWDWDVENDLTFPDARFAQLCSVSPECAAIGEPIGAFANSIHPEDYDEVKSKIREAISTGRDYIADYRLVQKDGSIRWVHARGRCQMDGNGVPTRFSGVVFDITQRKEFEVELAKRTAELTRSNEDLEEFAHVASHDLRSPLNAVLNLTQLLVRRHGQSFDPETGHVLVMIQDGAKRMAELISALLTYSKLNDSRTESGQKASAQEAYENAVANLDSAIHEAQAAIEKTDLPEVIAPLPQLSQVFQNVIANAIQYRGDAAPRIRIVAERQNNFWAFSVTDNGPGIAPQYHAIIFEPFKRLHGSDKPGSGIGLAFCRKFIERQGGQMWVDSEEGKGATFYFTLPAADQGFQGGAIQHGRGVR